MDPARLTQHLSADSQDARDEAIAGAAMQFRGALDAVGPALWKQPAVTAFPAGACGHASELLGRYLKDRLSVEADYICGDFYRADGSWRGSHAWLEVDGLIVDITGDQFGWERVIVTRSSPLHSGYELHLRHGIGLDPRWWAVHAAPIYAATLAMLDRGASVGHVANEGTSRG